MTPQSKATLMWLTLLISMSGCGLGTGAIFSSSDDASNSATVASSLVALRSATTPATVTFLLTDEEGDRASVRIEYATGTDGFTPITLAPDAPDLKALPTNGGSISVPWDFASDLGGDGYRDDIRLRLVVQDGLSPAELSGVSQGNDAPVVQGIQLPSLLQGASDLRIQLSDSAGDPVKVTLEYVLCTSLGQPLAGR